jgi:hypothetical protein
MIQPATFQETLRFIRMAGRKRADALDATYKKQRIVFADSPTLCSHTLVTVRLHILRRN